MNTRNAISVLVTLASDGSVYQLTVTSHKTTRTICSTIHDKEEWEAVEARRKIHVSPGVNCQQKLLVTIIGSFL